MIGNVVVLVLALFNSFVHSRDAWTSVVPSGLILSALTVIVLLFTGWMGGSMVFSSSCRSHELMGSLSDLILPRP